MIVGLRLGLVRLRRQPLVPRFPKYTLHSACLILLAYTKHCLIHHFLPVISIMALYVYWELFSGILLMYPIVLAAYRIFLHPLAHFPGPKLAAATGWYETYIDLFKIPRGNFMEEINRMHLKYGDDDL